MVRVTRWDRSQDRATNAKSSLTVICTDGLAVQRVRVQDAADILDGDVVEDFDLPGLRIHRDMRGVCAIAVGAF